MLIDHARSHGRPLGAVPHHIFCANRNFVAPRKICFKYIIKTKILTPKMYFAPKLSKPGYRPVLDEEPPVDLKKIPTEKNVFVFAHLI